MLEARYCNVEQMGGRALWMMPNRNHTTGNNRIEVCPALVVRLAELRVYLGVYRPLLTLPHTLQELACNNILLL